MTTSDQYDILHSVDPETETPSEGKPGVDMLDHPLAEIAKCDRVFALGWNGK
jgi:hypothetical protein